MTAIRQFLQRIRATGRKRPGVVRTVAMGRERAFDAYDIGNDTWIFERGVSRHLAERPSVLVVEKSRLRRKACGRVMTMTTGNHSVAAFPLLDGRFWKFSNLAAARRGDVLMHGILCANVVGNTIELSQRDVPTDDVLAADRWLRERAGFGLADVVMGDRNEMTLECLRRLGQEWRVKPLACTDAEMRAALAASVKRIASPFRYFHSTRGVHFLTCPEFRRLVSRVEAEPQEFLRGMKELVGVYEGNVCSFTRMEKYRWHHEIELFGLSRGVALMRLVPEIERLMEAVTLRRIAHSGVVEKARQLAALYVSLLDRPEFDDEASPAFAEALYMNITGEIYSVAEAGAAGAFRSRRTALPGATFQDGRQTLHPGADDRTEVLLSNLRGLMSKDEMIEYANVYELRTGSDDIPLGHGSTREVVYKTSRRPLENSLIEKRLSRSTPGYSRYLLSRIGVLRGLGIGLSDYYLLLRRRAGAHRRPQDYYIRRRCEGEPMATIPASYFRNADDSSVEEREVVLALATLMGDAAAQNMAMKKYDAETRSPLYGVGKEIYEFEYDILRERVVPKKVLTCSVRGSFGWPSLDYTEANLDALADFYLGHFARALAAYQAAHPSVTREEAAERFMGGFAFRTQAMAWQLSVMRDCFESFCPDVPRRFGFDRKWRFVMWALERQERRMETLRRIFMEKMK